MIRLQWSMATRLTVGLGLIASVVFSVAATVLHLALASELAAAGRANLAGKVAVVLHFIDEASRAADRLALFHHLDDLKIGHKGLQIWITSADGTVVYGDRAPSGNPAPPSTQAALQLDWQGTMLPPTAPWPGGRLRIAFDRTPREALLSAHLTTLFAVCAIGVAGTVLLSWFVIRRSMDIITRLSQEARSMTPEHPGRRLTAPPSGIELNGLVRSFNLVLDRLEHANGQLEAFNANVAHELRTPLAAIITGAHVTLSAQRTCEELRASLLSNLEELEQLNGLVNDMLFLARADRGDRPEGMRTVSLAAEAAKAARYCEVLLEDAWVSAECIGDGEASCNPALICRALVNLLTNAIRHTSAGGTVKIRVVATPDAVHLRVENPGPPIPNDVRQRMFDRFFRADPSRRQSGDGNHGLGLTIVAAIARMHGGRVFVECSGASNIVGFTLPVMRNAVAAHIPDGAVPRPA